MKGLILYICLLLPLNSFAKGDEIRNGGGLAEQYLVFALENLGVAIDLCLAKNECAKSGEGRDILKKIKEALPQEKSANILKFASEKKNPGFFVIDDVVRLAITGNKIGDPVYYNLDLLYQDNEINMTFGQATQTLIHELGHHVGALDHGALELLGAEVRSFIEGNVNDVPYLPHLQAKGFSAIGTETRSFTNSGSLSLVFSDKKVDLSRHLAKISSQCDVSTIDPLVSSSFQYFNLHWDHMALGGIVKGERVLAGNAILYCRHRYSKEYRKVYKFNIAVNVGFAQKYFYISDRLVEEPKYIFVINKDGVVLR